jgi:hypothetical protein
MTEEPRRLTPTYDTVRELYLKSGNECAFPGCNHRMIDESGVFIGEMCHIEAALPGGERFNALQTNEDRRSFPNLMLMCHAHHQVTNDVVSFPVERLREIKAAHEFKFTSAVEKIRSSISDQTSLDEIQYASTLARLNAVVGWGLEPEQLKPMVDEIHEFAESMKILPHRTRELLSIIVARGQGYNYIAGMWWALFDEIVEATHLEPSEIGKHVGILERYQIGYLDDDDGKYMIVLRPLPSRWRIWADLKDFGERTKTPLAEILVDLRFSILD